MKKLLRGESALIIRLSAAILWMAVAGVLLILEARSVAEIVDRVFLRGDGLNMLWPLLGLMLLWGIGRIVTQTSGEILALRAAIRWKSELRSRIVRHVINAGPDALRREQTGERLQLLTDGVEQLETYIARYLPQAVMAAALPITIGAVIFGLDLVTTAVLALTMPMLIFFMILIGWASRKHADRQVEQLNRLGGHFLDVLRGLPTLALFNRSKVQIGIIRRMSEQYREATMRTLRIAFLSAFAMELFATLSTAVVAVFLGLRLIDGGIDFYRAFLILLLVPEFYAPVRAVGIQYHAAMNGIAAAAKIADWLDANPAEDQLSDPFSFSSSSGKSDPDWHSPVSIVFDQVTFIDPQSGNIILDRVSFTAEAGKWTLISGMSGSGKSTLFDLLLGFRQPHAGSIRINDQDIRLIPREQLWRMFGTILQTPVIHPLSIKENIAFERPDAPHWEIEMAAQLAHVSEWSVALPQGLDTVLSEQVPLSGGQKQRLALARMMLKNAPVGLLDEPFSQLDPLHIGSTMQSLVNWREGRTLLMISHQPETFAIADRHVILQHGSIHPVKEKEVMMG